VWEPGMSLDEYLDHTVFTGRAPFSREDFARHVEVKRRVPGDDRP